MATGDLQLSTSEGFVGPAADFTKTDPGVGDTLVVTSNGQASSIVSALAAGGQRIKQASGLLPSITSNVQVADGSQYYAPSGSGLSFIGNHGQCFDFDNSINCFLGNLLVRADEGTDTSNNPGTSFLVERGAGNRLYAFAIGEVANTTLESGWANDGPEFWNIWNGPTADGEKHLTFDRCYGPTANTHHTKLATQGGAPEVLATGTWVLWYRGWQNGRARQPRFSRGINGDVVNFVCPGGAYHELSHYSAGIEVADAASNVAIRGCMIYGDGANFGEVYITGGTVYYITSGGIAADRNFESGTPTISGTVTSTDPLGAYTGKPTPNTASDALATEILAENYTTFAIAEESPPTTEDPPTPSPEGVRTWNALRRTVGRNFLNIVLGSPQPAEERVAYMRPRKFRRRAGAGIFVMDNLDNYPGLWIPPSYVPERKSFALGGV